MVGAQAAHHEEQVPSGGGALPIVVEADGGLVVAAGIPRFLSTFESLLRPSAPPRVPVCDWDAPSHWIRTVISSAAEMKDPWICPECLFEFCPSTLGLDEARDRLRRHQQTAHPAKAGSAAPVGASGSSFPSERKVEVQVDRPSSLLQSCPECGVRVHPDRMARHIRKVHGHITVRAKAKGGDKVAERIAPGLVSCPYCQYWIRDRDLESHIVNTHKKSGPKPRQTVQGGLVSSQ